jgi:hypothetical protein
MLTADRMPGFGAEATVYTSTRSYRSARASVAGDSRAIAPAAPRCQNCDFVCDVCARTGRVCGGCRLCMAGICDRFPPEVPQF